MKSYFLNLDDMRALREENPDKPTTYLGFPAYTHPGVKPGEVLVMDGDALVARFQAFVDAFAPVWREVTEAAIHARQAMEHYRNMYARDLVMAPAPDPLMTSNPPHTWREFWPWLRAVWRHGMRTAMGDPPMVTLTGQQALKRWASHTHIHISGAST